MYLTPLQAALCGGVAAGAAVGLGAMAGYCFWRAACAHTALQYAEQYAERTPRTPTPAPAPQQQQAAAGVGAVYPALEAYGQPRDPERDPDVAPHENALVRAHALRMAQAARERFCPHCMRYWAERFPSAQRAMGYGAVDPVTGEIVYAVGPQRLYAQELANHEPGDLTYPHAQLCDVHYATLAVVAQAAEAGKPLPEALADVPPWRLPPAIGFIAPRDQLYQHGFAPTLVWPDAPDYDPN